MIYKIKTWNNKSTLIYTNGKEICDIIEVNNELYGNANTKTFETLSELITELQQMNYADYKIINIIKMFDITGYYEQREY